VGDGLLGQAKTPATLDHRGVKPSRLHPAILAWAGNRRPGTLVPITC
jgi:hypothetical protein